MIEAFLFIGVSLLIGRVLAEFHNRPVRFLSQYRVSMAEYRQINKNLGE